MAKTDIILSKTLKTLIVKHKLTIKKLSKETGIPNSTLASYLTDRKANYDINHLLKIADYFDVSVDFILRGKEVRNINIKNLKLEDLFDGFVKIKVQRVLTESNYEIDD